jgi:hypothetical protein
MKKISLCIIISLLPLGQAYAVDTEQLTLKSRTAVKALGSELKSALQGSMKANGVIETISVCNIKAPEISNRISQDNNMSVGRTSLKYRNPKNKPDEWEKTVLDQFEQRKANGETIDMLEFSELTELDGKKVFRYMKAIPTDDVCLSCHGDNVAQPFVSKINSLYTDDKAIGFKKGDIRGAFTVIQTVN